MVRRSANFLLMLAIILLHVSSLVAAGRDPHAPKAAPPEVAYRVSNFPLCQAPPTPYPSPLLMTTNVFAALALIFLNKLLLSSSHIGVSFLSGLHFLATSAVSHLNTWRDRSIPPQHQHLAGSPPPPPSLPMAHLALFVAIANLSIISLNLSLKMNPVVVYQVREC